MHGPDVAEVQRLLGVADDGVFGPETAHAVAGWKRARGVQPPSNELDPLDRRELLGDVLLRAVRLMERWADAGVGEDPVGSNRVPELVSLANRLDVRPEFSQMGYPWCAFAAFLAALVARGRTAAFGLRRKAFNPLYVPELLAEAKAHKFGLALVELGRRLSRRSRPLRLGLRGRRPCRPRRAGGCRTAERTDSNCGREFG
jgi:hypothetical protein